jgi:cellulose synthase/poly-beta-1,6-N-acetylglucosamine synthase-like glycosyltransferase
VIFDWFNGSLAILTGLPVAALLMLISFSLLLEWPRYITTFLPALAIIFREYAREPGPMPEIGKVSILIPGHNEADSIEQCVLSLAEQTYRDFEIVCVSDGSTDDTYKIMKRLQREGKVDKIAECAIRGGKSSAINLGMRMASGDIVIVIDCDCSFDRTAIEELLRPFAKPNLAAVGGSVLVRNGNKSITASLQTIEYMVGIQLGRTGLDMFGQLSIISGAFGAFRREAFMKVGMMDQGPGEDGDITMRLRLAGYDIGFAVRSVAYTDVPVHMFNLIKQRQRWERDALWTRTRKYGFTFNPFHPGFRLRELPHQIDFLVMDVICSSVAPFYLVWLLVTFGLSFTLFLVVLTYIAFLAVDMFMFVCACLGTGKNIYWRFWPYIFIYGPWKGYFMRYARIYTYIEEWIWSASRHDNFAPPKVNDWIRWK